MERSDGLGRRLTNHLRDSLKSNKKKHYEDSSVFWAYESRAKPS